MASSPSFCRSLAMAATRLAPRSYPSKALRGKTTRSSVMRPPSLPSVCRLMGCAESLIPLHSAIASACLKSMLSVNSNCWSLLSQDHGVLENLVEK
ncbi:protein NUCLEAR FUSION DEFECTIVE 6, chloroplastic/mitochondrial isoform X1 [Amborella trichopoda]|uniref:protein NUCLEAR FUSION DEFECTIVE 6, chloroplastic/mitochondrial isoform X1 n=1 Tax=Amborella trichopoda TaxID=13333 RepID=UPI0009BD4C43|nr:protein NUCLEAR FUSION DEFECTIVE 6, chloroplastic/mitochondrial isoform X1 [Amborella trichopoda]|eukprot:XP_020530273.1 protein NUCLEAR FUSION DEFECTIVE 6, chloroplastic/mitochondrial isoform X1 [Amborella trichopoda]